MALVIVLALLVLLAALVIGFFGRTTVESSAASAYFEDNRNALFADQAASLVEAQINHASTRPRTAWASQPGMVRTFEQDGSLKLAYKLYSDSEMVASTASIAHATAALEDWHSAPAVFVDLNEPVNDVWPILDPAGLGKVEGFDVTGAPATAKQPVPMPVKWLYVLEDGTLVAAENTGSGTRASVPGATIQNPIVGRIAFWTDDDTSKLNINTASHGSFWDIPRAASLEERDRMARFQPAAREFQRYPGHPATTSLAPVFGHLFGGPGNLSEAGFEAFVLGLVPRIQGGGSQRGTQVPTSPVTLDTDRLYSSPDELLFKPDRTTQSVSGADLEMARFFITARSNAPEVNLFNLPRMAIWPINASPKAPSTIDRLIAFCATINGVGGSHPYYLQRAFPESATQDMTAFPRNRQLYNYINTLLETPFPGFGNTSFAQKYTPAETRQIVTQIFDYIRSSNLYSTAFGATAYTNESGSAAAPVTLASRVGQVTPLQIDSTKGFGRIPMLSRAVLQFFVSGARMPVVDAGGSPIVVGGQPLESEFIPTRAGVNSSAGGRTARTPPLSYSDTAGSTLYNSWKSFLNGRAPFTSTGQYHGDTAKLLTSSIIYFDTFDPMVGYSAPKYNFDVRVRFSGPWTVSANAASAAPLNFPNSTLEIRRDQSLLYNARTDNVLSVWHGREIGGPLLPLWMMQNYSWLRGNPTDASNRAGHANPYPLVSDRIAVHLPITLDNQGSLTNANRDFPEYSTVEAQMGAMTFSGGSMIAEIVVGNEVVQTYTFEFPGFTKPLPGYENESANHIPKQKQMPVSMDFRHRWQSEPRKSILFGTGTDYDYPDLRLVQGRDVVVSLVPALGDKRILAAKSSLGSADFQPHEHYNNQARRAAIDFRDDPINATLSHNVGKLSDSKILNIDYGRNALPDISNPQQAMTLAFPPDFDNGPFALSDDVYINRADETSAKDTVSGGDDRQVAWYFDSSNVGASAYASLRDNETFYSPNRQMPSAVMFGSLPTGVARNHPWQTLLLRPNPGNHPGAGDPPDYTLLDLFWMPVVEPWAISEPFSTSGKVNMNYQIMPFGGYLTRATALHGVLQTEEMLVLENAHAYTADATQGGDEYKRISRNETANFSTIHFRKKIDIPETLKGFQAVFDQDRVFRSETEICSLPLVPRGAVYSDDFETAYWNDKRLTGDNSRERPYANILPKLTVRSNTYTIHFRVQSLKKTPATPADTWDEERDKVTAEHRGSRTIERYIDPNDKRIPDYAAADPAGLASLEKFYRWRVLANRSFSP